MDSSMAKKPTPVDDAQIPQDAVIITDTAPEAEVAVDAPAQPATKKGTGKAVVLGFLLGIIAAALGYGAALKFPLFPATTTAAAPAVDLGPITARLDALDSKSDTTDLQALLAKLESAPQTDAAAIEGRRSVGAEMDPVTYAKAMKRIKAGHTPSMFPA